MLANGVGIIDADYYNNESNEGEIFLQMVNFSPFNIMIKKGEAIGQGIIKPYLTTDNDNHGGKRNGGFGSTTVTEWQFSHLTKLLARVAGQFIEIKN